MNLKTAIIAATTLLASIGATSAFALVPSSQLYDFDASSSVQSHSSDVMEDGVVLLFGSDRAPVTTVHDTLADGTVQSLESE